MREMGGGVGPGEIYDPYGGGAAGAAGIGVARARSTRNDGGYAAGLQDGAAPYAAFAVPTQQHDPYASQPQPRGVGRDTNTDILEAAGMGAHVAGAGVLSRGQSQYKNAYNSQYQPYPSQSQAQPQYGGLHQRSPSQLQQAQELEYANLNRGKSMGSREGGHGGSALPLSAASNATSNATQYYSPVADSYQSHSYNTQGGGQQQNPPHPVAEEDMDDAYGGYVADEHQGGGGAVAVGGATAAVATSVGAKRQSGLPNPFEAGSSTGHGKQEFDDRDSRYSDEEEEAPKRVLKVRFRFVIMNCELTAISLDRSQTSEDEIEQKNRSTLAVFARVLSFFVMTPHTVQLNRHILLQNIQSLPYLMTLNERPRRTHRLFLFFQLHVNSLARLVLIYPTSFLCWGILSSAPMFCK
jgi:hypothetical protein